MAKVRSILIVSWLLLWTFAPALTCLPNRQMTQAEMECCKKMAGDCHRGPTQHPCCKTAPNVDVPVATVQHVPQIHADLAILCQTKSLQLEPADAALIAQTNLGLPPPAPPGATSVLRI
ncbi:MAG: hypothetical protein DMG80_08440 [Acidobacteria bacterium]|nr:MAG: hypothetical protein DMG80_08440 [Acidobacteriota bacterium]